MKIAVLNFDTMKRLYTVLPLFCMLAAAWPAAAQFSIDEVDAKQSDVRFRDEVKTTSANADYFSPARYRAERAAIRKERNTLEFGGGLMGALTNYNDPWVAVSGGDNSIALTANLFLNHTFTKNLFTIETKVIGKFGYNRMKVEVTNDDGETTSNGRWFKNQDEFEMSTAPSFKMSKNWSYGAIVKFRSQFANGYVSRTQQELEDRKSRFMTPGYLDASLGVTYKCPHPKFPIVVNLSPIALNATYARNERIRKDNGFAYGIEDVDKRSKYEGGSSIQIDFDRTFGKTEFLRYRTMLYGFYGWITDMGQDNKIRHYGEYKAKLEEWEAGDKNIKDKPRLPIHPVVRWTNTIDIKATKYLSTSLSFELYYNRAQNMQVQTKTLLSVGLSYTFKNK